MILNPGMWAVVGYRYCRWVRTCGLPRWLRWPFGLVAAVVQLWVEVTTTIQLSAAARIGPGLYVPHTGATVIGSGSILGSNCTLCHGVTIGHRGGGRHKNAGGNPVFGDRVYIGPGSAIVGPITVGDDAVIGVGAVVIRPVPLRAVVAGNPARVLSQGGSFDLICYPGMEQDPARLASLAMGCHGRNGEAANLVAVTQPVQKALASEGVCA
ncbi:MAG TPA: DapH/DapD/GlmU-related protein [Gemmataceae bacterium]|jgi:serine O-acetyltransferase|nr:DapH/DapD/GlmU-related protein [Gemmataceae bacterium]